MSLDSQSEQEWREKLYPHKDDPRRDPNWGTRSHESETRQLLSAVLTQLYHIAEILEKSTVL